MVCQVGGMVRLSYSRTRKESGLCCTKVYWVICIGTIAWIWTLCLYLFWRDASILVSDESSTRMASLEEGNWILRGTRTVVTAETQVAFGFRLKSSGLLLDLLVELGSVGGVRPDILTQTKLNFCERLQLTSLHASFAQRPKQVPIDKDDRSGTVYYPNQLL